MTRFSELPGSQLNVVYETLSLAMADETHAKWMQSEVNAKMIVEFIERQKEYEAQNSNYNLVKNRYEADSCFDAKSCLLALRLANKEEGWGITENDFYQLVLTAPSCLGHHRQLSFRIRWGQGDEGVLTTFRRHIERIRRVLGDDFAGANMYEDLEPTVKAQDRIKLLNGNNTHEPVIEWVIINLELQHEGRSIEEIRGKNSPADELLVWAWLYPKYYNTNGFNIFVAAGYQTRVTLTGGRQEEEYYASSRWDDVLTVSACKWKVSIDRCLPHRKIERGESLKVLVLEKI